MRELTSYDPHWAPRVRGKIEAPATREDGLPEEQKIFCECLECGTKWQTTCSSGHVRVHVNKFALQHIHRDPLDPIPGAPGMPA